MPSCSSSSTISSTGCVICRCSCSCSPVRRSTSGGPASDQDGTGSASRSTRSTRRRWTPSSRRSFRDLPRPARSMIVERAQGIPLYAVESIRALIDRDVVRPIEGVYRIVGDVGQLEVPDSLHALLAARLDALDPQVRQVLTGAAVLGSSFPAEAVAGVSGLPSDDRRVDPRPSCCAARSCRCPPIRGRRSGGTTGSPRRCCGRSPTRRCRAATARLVTSPSLPILRATFPRDGEEVIDVVARHYVDALEAVPDDRRRRRDPRAGGRRVDAGGRACRPGRLARPRRRRAILDAADLVERADTR